MVSRHDLATDPSVIEDLAAVRLGTAFFRRALSQVNDQGLDVPTTLPGWTRRHLAAHVGYNAQAIARLVQWAATGIENCMYDSPTARSEEIELGATLSPAALRNLCEHTAIDLDARWRDLPDKSWTSTVVTAQGRHVRASETLWMRSREVWLHATDLASGQNVQDIPHSVLDRLLADVFTTWTKRGTANDLAVVVQAGNGTVMREYGDPALAGTVLQGCLPDLVEWATGRSSETEQSSSLRWVTGDAGPAPRWI